MRTCGYDFLNQYFEDDWKFISRDTRFLCSVCHLVQSKFELIGEDEDYEWVI